MKGPRGNDITMMSGLHPVHQFSERWLGVTSWGLDRVQVSILPATLTISDHFKW